MMISATSPDRPGALCLCIFFNATATSLILMQSAGPFLSPYDILSFYDPIHSLYSSVFPCTPSMCL